MSDRSLYEQAFYRRDPRKTLPVAGLVDSVCNISKAVTIFCRVRVRKEVCKLFVLEDGNESV